MANAFSGLDVATLTSLRDSLVDGIRKVALNQSYSLNGRSLTRADLGQLRTTLAEVQGALDEVTGETATETRVNFTGL
jgi:hypothetical protein